MNPYATSFVPGQKTPRKYVDSSSSPPDPRRPLRGSKSFIKGVAANFYRRGFYGEKKPSSAKYGGNNHFIIGCTLGTYEESQRISFLRNQPGLSKNTYYAPDEDFPAPQLIFSVDGPNLVDLVVRVEFTPPPNGEERNVFSKFITEEEMLRMLTEIRDLGIDLYEA